ncbi:hypothetical protein JHK85_035123 [Glycine max]|nr:hypothetical protein JHK85_035123 [Glycine max]
MFGGVNAPANSPHLRKSGSRPVVYDLDEHEVENGVEEGLLHPVEASDSKGGVIPVSAAAMMPSPVLLWRFKIEIMGPDLKDFIIFLQTGGLQVGWDSVMRMSADKRELFLYEAFLYFNPLLLAALMVWLWGINLWFFSQGGVNYAKIFDLDQNHLTHREIWKQNEYCSYYWDAVARMLCIWLVQSFVDKVFSDLERSVCRMVHRQVATIAWLEADSVCGSHSVAIPLVLVLPYLFRLNQCLRQYKDTGEKTTLLNALKYSTAVPVIFLSALKYHVFPERWTNFYRPLWLLSGVVNSSYSFYWDVNRDWDLSGFTRIFKFNKPHLFSHMLHGRRWVYFWVIGSNLVLRCTWTYKLSAHLRHNYLTVFFIAALEIFRRFQWIFFRVENEWNKMNSKSHSHLSVNEIPDDEEKLLHSINYSV